MEERVKDELTRQFRDYLESDFMPEEAPADDIDQISLFNELAGLKNEVRIESRQLKVALDDFRQAFTSLDSGRQELVELLHNHKRRERETDLVEITPVILGLLDLYDRIGAGLERELPPPSLTERLLPAARRSRRWLQGHLEGQQMLLGRVIELLAQYGVAAIETKGEQFDPQVMKAVGFEYSQGRQEGVVLREFRKGFRQNRRIVRPAEVIVNKRGKAV